LSKIENNKKYKRDSLLDSAFTLFIQKGINKTSIQDIAAKSGVAKGTFYLYFKDKYDLRNILIAHKASQLFQAADIAMHKAGITDTIEQMLFIVDHIIDDLAQDKKLLLFISKNLSWGIFKSTLINSSNTENLDFYDIYTQLLNQDQYDFIDPEIMLFMIIELVSSTCYSSILYNEPVKIEDLKPYLYDAVRNIIDRHIA
jgi:AcrR family transcriptional regulator